MRTTYIFDTSALIYDPRAFENYPNSNCLLPIAVLNELDKLKKLPSEAGKNARVAIRLIDEISSKGDISTGILLDDDILLKIDATYLDCSQPPYQGLGDPSYGDTQILACAQLNWHNHPDHNVVLVSNDINLRVKAKSRSIDAEPHDNKGQASNDLYSGLQIVANEEAGLKLQRVGSLNPQDYDLKLSANECLLLEADNGDVIAMGRQVAPDKIKMIKKYYPWNIAARNAEQAFLIDLIMDDKIDLITAIGQAGTGKAQPLDADILTPNGWVKMGDIKIGNSVSTPDGLSSKVIGIFPQGEKDIFKVSFSDGTSTECCGDHLWQTQTVLDRNAKRAGSVKSTMEIQKSIVCRDRKNHSIPITNAVEMPKKNLVLDPYSFGCLLGDGSFRHQLKFTSNDNYIIETVDNSLSKIGMKFVQKNQYDYSIVGVNKIKNVKEVSSVFDGVVCKTYRNIREAVSDGYSLNIIYKALSQRKEAYGMSWKYGKYQTDCVLLNYLRENNLWMKKSVDKFIPDDYKYSSVEDRLAILQGLMDTDGSVSKDGKYFEYTTISSRLANDVKWLVQSLGGTININERHTKYVYKNQTKNGQLSYRLSLSLPNNINPFKLPRKANLVRERIKYNPRRYIVGVENIGKKSAQCILIDHPNHLYITNDCIVTHNTLVALAAALELVINKREYEKLIVYRPIQSVGNDIGYLPGSLAEKLLPWFQAIMDSFEFLFSNKSNSDWKKELEMFQRKGRIELDAITFIRGRSIPNAIILVDEAQNLSAAEIKTILTRAGEHTKIILTGDIEQIDNGDLDATDNGLTNTIHKFKDWELAGHMTLTKGERSRLASVAAKIL